MEPKEAPEEPERTIMPNAWAYARIRRNNAGAHPFVEVVGIGIFSDPNPTVYEDGDVWCMIAEADGADYQEAAAKVRAYLESTHGWIVPFIGATREDVGGEGAFAAQHLDLTDKISRLTKEKTFLQSKLRRLETKISQIRYAADIQDLEPAPEALEDFNRNRYPKDGPEKQVVASVRTFVDRMNQRSTVIPGDKSKSPEGE